LYYIIYYGVFIPDIFPVFKLKSVTEERCDGYGNSSAFYCGILGSTLGSETDTTPMSLQDYDCTVPQIMP